MVCLVTRRSVTVAIVNNINNMKRKHIAIVIVVGLALGGVALIKKDSPIEYIQGETQVVEKTVEIETLQKRIDDAITASSTDIETQAQNAYNETKAQAQKEVELEVTRKYRAEIEAREAELEEQVSL